MKTLHLTTIAFVLVLSSQLAYATTYGGHLGPITIQMPFMKTDSTGTITIKYVVYYPHNDTFDTTFAVYDGKLQNPEPLTLKDLTINAEPKSINLLENNTVTYTIVAKNNIKGVYGIAPIFPCSKYPLVVGLNESEIIPSTLFRLSMPVHCGVISSDAPVREIINYDGIILKNVTRTQDQFSPMEQAQLGSNSTDVQCTDSFTLVIKTEDGSPACVKPNTASKLVERGWMLISISAQQNIPVLSNSIRVQNTNFTINYDIIGNGKILDANADVNSKSLILSLKTIGNGTLTTSIPRTLIDAKLPNGHDDKFFVLIDGQEADFEETKATVTQRILIIPFGNDVHKIEIIGVQLI